MTAKVDASIDELIDRSSALKARAMTKAGLDSVLHHLRGIRADSIGKDATLAPFTIYPFAPQLAAAPTTDLVCYEHIVGWDRVDRAFNAVGFEVELLLSEEHGSAPDDVAVLHDRHADRRVTIHRGGLDQLLHELIDVDRYAAAVAATSGMPRAARRATAVLTFSNERAVWK